MLKRWFDQTLMYSIDPNDIRKYFPKLKNGGYVPFQPSHLINFKGYDNYGTTSTANQDRERNIIHQSTCGPAITAYINNRVVAIFGCVIIWNGLGEAWSLFDQQARRYPIAMTKGANAFFDICEILFTLHRIQITVRSNDQRAVSWAKFLHFKQEGLLTEYSSDKQDYYIMRRA